LFDTEAVSGPVGFRILAVFRRVLALLGGDLAKGRREDADEATELLGEVAGASEAHLLGHHAPGEVGVLEQILGTLDPLPHDVLVRREPVESLNILEKWYGLMLTSRAISASVKSAPRLSPT